MAIVEGHLEPRAGTWRDRLAWNSTALIQKTARPDDTHAEDAISDGENGLLVPQGDPAAVADAVLRLLDDPEAARAMGERGRERALSRDWSHVVDEYLAIYDRVLRR